jgi:hypothetical protein
MPYKTLGTCRGFGNVSGRATRAAQTQADHCSCRMILDSSSTHWSADACAGRRPVDMAALMLVTVGDPEGFLRSLALILRLSQMRTPATGNPDTA